MSRVTIGADPEVFVKDIMSQTILSAIDRVGGSKDYPRPVTNGFVQEDNILAEFNINPAENKNQFVNGIKSVMSDPD